MESSYKDTPVVLVEELDWLPGRHGFHFEPDFCGTMNVVLDGRSPYRVRFSCESKLIDGEVLTISDGGGHTTRVRITRSNGDRYTATVVVT